MSKDDTVQYLIDNAAFVDRIDVGISGKVLTDSGRGFIGRESLPIGGRASLYARVLHLTDELTGQHVALKYGRLKRNFKRIPEITASFCSGHVPLSAAQVWSLLARLIEGRSSTHVSTVEMTFDLSTAAVIEVLRQVHARSLPHSKYWGDGLETFYVGSRSSLWSLRVYRRLPSGITRIEFVFRRPFIRALNISDLQELVFLRRFDLTTISTFRAVDKGALKTALQGIPHAKASLLYRLLVAHPQIVERCLRREYRIDTSAIFPMSPLQTKLLRMQRNFIW